MIHYNKTFTEQINATDNDQGEIKRCLYKRYLIVARELFRTSLPNKEVPYLGEERQGRLLIFIATICFALEAFVNDILFSINENDTAKIIEKHELKEKIKYIYKSVQIIETKEIPSYQQIIDLQDIRDLLVHYKPYFRKTTDEEDRLINKINHKKAKNFYKSIIIFMKDTVKLCNLESDFDWLIGYSDEIHKE